VKIMIGDEELLWHFSCRATRLPDGRYRVIAKGLHTDKTYERVGHNPLHELIRVFGDAREERTNDATQA
jgi:hypothetical protein